MAIEAAGMHCAAFGKPDLAERYFRRALEKEGTALEARLHLAEILERRHQLEEAGKMIEPLLHPGPAGARALLQRARLDRAAGNLEAAERHLREAVTRPGEPPEVSADCYYELGNVLDRQKRYDEAMAAFLEAKTILRPMAAAARTRLRQMQAQSAELARQLSPEIWHRWQNDAPRLKPDRRLAVLCGHPRSGTTLLEQVLDSHPDVITAEETRVFDLEINGALYRGLANESSLFPRLDAAAPEALQKLRDHYFRCLELQLGQGIGPRLLVDKNPSLTTSIPALLKTFPEARLLIAIRDPRDICISCFMQSFGLNPVGSAGLSLEDTVEQYIVVMNFWLAIRPHLAGKFMEIRYEDLVTNLPAAARKTLEFLGLDWNEKVLHFDEHARQKRVSSPSYRDVARPVFSHAVSRWRNYEKFLAPWLEKLAPLAKAFGYD